MVLYNLQHHKIADHVVESRPHIIDGKEIDVKHASAESHERHQQQLAAAAVQQQPQPQLLLLQVHMIEIVKQHPIDKRNVPDGKKQQQQQLLDSTKYYFDMITSRSNTHIAFIQRDMITYPVPIKYLREDTFLSTI